MLVIGSRSNGTRTANPSSNLGLASGSSSRGLRNSNPWKSDYSESSSIKSDFDDSLKAIDTKAQKSIDFSVNLGALRVNANTDFDNNTTELEVIDINSHRSVIEPTEYRTHVGVANAAKDLVYQHLRDNPTTLDIIAERYYDKKK